VIPFAGKQSILVTQVTLSRSALPEAGDGNSATRMLRKALLLIACLTVSTLSIRGAARYEADAPTLERLSGPLQNGARVRLESVPLLDGGPETLELEKFELWTSDAEIKVFGPNGTIDARLPIPSAQYFRGRVAGEPDSLVFLSVQNGLADGLVYAHEKKFAIGSRRVSRDSAETRLLVEESSVLDDYPIDGAGFTCEVEKTQVGAAHRPHAVSDASGQPVSLAAPTGTQRSVLRLAVETDYELFVKAGSSAANVTQFIGNLIGAASTVYERDLLTEIRLAYLGIQDNAADPFTVVPVSGAFGVSPMDALLELGTIWHTAPPTSNQRSAVTLISGKSLASGVAWVGTVCDPDFAYGDGYGGRYSYCGGVDPPDSLAVPNPNASPTYAAPSSNYWPLLQLTHELGHNVGSSHTHCISLTSQQQSQYAVTRSYVDECYTASGCYSGATSVPVEKGTIMSYCHLRSGGASNMRFTFGQAGETSEIVRNNMRGNMAAVTPSLSSITAPATLAVGSTGAASVASASLSYAWSITNGTINSGQGTSAIQFTSQANPVTVRVTATNSSGCAVTDSVNVGSVAAAPPAPPGVVATAVSATTVSVSWAASAGASTYTVWRSDGGAYANVGSAGASLTFNDTTAAANNAYRYAVRAVAADGVTASPLGATDVATTVIFTDGVITAGATAVRAVHFTELLVAVNAMRRVAGLAEASFSDLLAADAVISGTHLTELRVALAAANAALARPPITYSDSVIAGATEIRAVHIVELRDGVR
jgi:hypothetical protein